jgi:hypothetical protein
MRDELSFFASVIDGDGDLVPKMGSGVFIDQSGAFYLLDTDCDQTFLRPMLAVQDSLMIKINESEIELSQLRDVAKANDLTCSGCMYVSHSVHEFPCAMCARPPRPDQYDSVEEAADETVIS